MAVFDTSKVFHHAIQCSIKSWNAETSTDRDQMFIRYSVGQNVLLEEDTLNVTRVRTVKKDDSFIVICETTQTNELMSEMTLALTEKVRRESKSFGSSDYTFVNVLYDRVDKFTREDIRLFLNYIFSDVKSREVVRNSLVSITSQGKKTRRFLKAELSEIVNADAIDPDYIKKLENRLSSFISFVTILLSWTPVTTTLELAIGAYNTQEECLITQFADMIERIFKYID